MKYIKQYESMSDDYLYEVGDHILLRNKVPLLDE